MKLFRTLSLCAVSVLFAAVAGVPAWTAKRPAKAAPKKPAKAAPKKPGPPGAKAAGKGPKPAPKPVARPAARSGAVSGKAGTAGLTPAPAGNGPSPASALPGAAPVPPLMFRTGAEYEARADLKTDFVAVHGHGRSWEEIDRALLRWKQAGYPVHRSFFAVQDAGALYSRGVTDGTAHPGEIDRDAQDREIAPGEQPIIVPTEGWLAYLKEHIRRAVDAGADGIWPEDPALYARGGYSPAFKAAWEEFYSTSWQPPHTSPETFFRASRLKADLSLRTVASLLRYTKEYAAQQGRDVKVLLPLQSPLAYASADRIFPHASVSRLPIDGVLAQVWTDSAREPVAFEGSRQPRPFESAWLQYSYFSNLLAGLPGKALYFAADPLDGDLTTESRAAHRAILAASLLSPAAGYEVIPWPERVAPPAPGTPEARHAQMLGNLAAALRELPAAGPPQWQGGTQGIGILALETLGWQRGGPSGSSLRSFFGLALPLLTRGVAAELVPAERAADPGFLSRFRVLLLSYDAQKPLGPELHQALAAWVKSGGTLLLIGGADGYSEIGEWWNRNGFSSPQDHLLKECGAGVETAFRSVLNPAVRGREALRAEGRARLMENRRLYSLPLEGHRDEGKPLYVRFDDLHPEDGPGAWIGRVRLVEGSRVRADFVAGSAAERPFLAQEVGTRTEPEGRIADRDAWFVYRFNRVGPEARLELELANEFRVSVAAGEDPAVVLEPAGAGALPRARIASSYPVVAYPLAGAEPLYRTRGTDPNGPPSPAWWSRAERGNVLFCGVPSSFGADSAAGADLVRSLVRLACEKAGVSYSEGPVIARRGSYVIARSLGRTVSLKGQYIDLFDPELPLVQDPQLPYREPGFYKEVLLRSRIPTLLHSSHRTVPLEASAAQMRLQLSGPAGTPGIARIYTAGMALVGVEARDGSGAPVPVRTRVEGRTLRVEYPQSHVGIRLSLRWLRPEARVTE